MNIKTFFHKITSRYLWGHLAAMALILVLLFLLVAYGLDFYTNHGKVIEVPDVVRMSYDDAKETLSDAGLKIVVSDTGYVKSLPADCILEQSLSPGERVKPNRIVYVTINSANAPMLSIPDVIDNSSFREARMKLKSMGFKLGQPQFIPGEKDWVYGITCRGKQLAAGAWVSVEDLLILQVGDGRRDLNDSIAFIDPVYEYEEEKIDAEKPVESEEKDDFEVVTEPEEKTENI